MLQNKQDEFSLVNCIVLVIQCNFLLPASNGLSEIVLSASDEGMLLGYNTSGLNVNYTMQELDMGK